MKKDEATEEESKQVDNRSQLAGDDFFSDYRREKDDRSSTNKEPQFTVQDWINSVLILVSVRLGLKKVQKEYFAAVKHFFKSKLNVGIIGGRPKEAYYLVGI